MFKAIVLDLFDTLVNWDPEGLPVMHWKGRDIHTTLPWILPKVAEELGADYDRDIFMAAYSAVYEEINQEREREGIEITCLERFMRTLVLMSSLENPKNGCETMADTGVKDKFEALITSADVGLRKPNPKIFERMLTMLNLTAPEVLFVGDTPHHDVGGAKAVGMSAAWISRHALPIPDGVAQPDYIIRDLAELPDVLENS
jgi:HAD superfamily hydrolase (TIGR01549 family)